MSTTTTFPPETTRRPPDSVPDYTISTNPPNPRSSFRLGDWMCVYFPTSPVLPGHRLSSVCFRCTLPSCAAHNFGCVFFPLHTQRYLFRTTSRNLMCIGCGRPRSNNPTPAPLFTSPPTPLLPSPRFVSAPTYLTSFTPTAPTPPYHRPPSTSSFQPLTDALNPPKPPPPSHPLLTPSGRAFASGGKVQNVSTDPLTPCVMYWPDNEPLPEQGQIRPSGLSGVPVSRYTHTHMLHTAADIDVIATPYTEYRESWANRSVFSLLTRPQGGPSCNIQSTNLATGSVSVVTTSTGGVERSARLVSLASVHLFHLLSLHLFTTTCP